MELAPATVNNHLKKAGALMEWLALRYENVQNPFSRLKVKIKTRPQDQRAAYTEAEAQRLDSWSQGIDEWKRVLIALIRYTGARVNEICQLRVQDINLAEGYLVITDEGQGQVLKTANSSRIIPLHPKLYELGIERYVNGRVTERQLFPLKPFRGSHSHQFTKWYSQVRKRVEGLPELAGARHTVATTLKHKGIPEQYVAALLGHSMGQGISFTRYGKDLHQLGALRDAINLL